MGAMVLSSGRSGTNLLLAMLEGHGFFAPIEGDPEDKMCWFSSGQTVPLNYLRKADTHYIINFDFMKQFLISNPHIQILWMVRDPRDWAMSKIRRGIERDSYDATFDGVIADLFHMFRLYKQLEHYMPERMMPVKMERLILNPKEVLIEICNFLHINFNEEMLDFRHNLKKKELKERYSGLDSSQIGLYKTWDQVYDGFLTKLPFDLAEVFKYLNPLIQYYHYDYK